MAKVYLVMPDLSRAPGSTRRVGTVSGIRDSPGRWANNGTELGAGSRTPSLTLVSTICPIASTSALTGSSLSLGTSIILGIHAMELKDVERMERVSIVFSAYGIHAMELKGYQKVEGQREVHSVPRPLLWAPSLRPMCYVDRGSKVQGFALGAGGRRG